MLPFWHWFGDGNVNGNGVVMQSKSENKIFRWFVCCLLISNPHFHKWKILKFCCCYFYAFFSLLCTESLLFIHFDFESHNIDETRNEKREWGNFPLLPDTWPFLLKCVSICSFFHFAMSANIANQKGQIKVYFHSLAPWLQAFFIIYQR